MLPGLGPEDECASAMNDDAPHSVPAKPTARRPDARAAAAVPRIVWRRPESASTARPEGRERRAVRRALEDWQRLRASGANPALTDLSPLRNPTDWADRFLLACDREPARSVFVLCGAQVEQAFGQRLIGRTLGEVAARQSALIQACSDAVREQSPCEVEDGFHAAGRRLVLYRAVFMPVRGADMDEGFLMGAYGCFVAAE